MAEFPASELNFLLVMIEGALIMHVVLCRFIKITNNVNVGQDVNLTVSCFLFFARRVDGMIAADTQLTIT